MGSRKCDIEKKLREWFRDAGRVVIVGIGNPIRMDDFVGMKIVQDLKGRVDTSRVMLIEAETVPENYLQEIIEFKPSHVLIIDAARMEKKTGEARLTSPEQLTDYPAFSTHMLPLRIFCEYLDKETKTKTALLLIEPKLTDFGEGLTSEVDVLAKATTSALSTLLS